jgi:tetratricopeptide (TPR) repeat protein
MGGRYGMSFASELNEDGRYDEAIEAATKAIEAGDVTAEPFVDRATAYDFLERHTEAVADFERAIDVNKIARSVDADVLDDAYFSALVSGGRKQAETSKEAAAAGMGRYVELLPSGRHVKDVQQWQARLRGELVSLLDKSGGP